MSRSGPSLRRHILPGLFVALLFVTLWQRRPDPDAPGPELLTFTGQTMGTTFSVKLRSLYRPNEDQAVSEALKKELSLVIRSMSTYEADSELSLWNQRTETQSIQVSEPLATVVRAALEIAKASGGAFDVTVQPLVDLWGFGPTKRSEKPTAEEVAKALMSVGWQKLTFDDVKNTLGKTSPKVWLDLSAIAKGYAVDRISARLSAMGYQHHFVEVGGEVRAVGQKTSTLPWRVGIEQPRGGNLRRLSFPLVNQSVATSGSYRNYRKYGEDTFTHTLDPRTGFPVDHRLISVSVVHRECMMADAWATALSVLGATEGYALATRMGLAASFLHAEEGAEPTVTQTETFKLLLGPAKIPTK